MLVDVKPEIKSEEKLDLDQQLKAFQLRLQSQTVLPLSTNTVSSNTENAGKEHKDAEPEEVVNFGWIEIKNGPLIPFIQKESEKYVAHHIVNEKVYKHIEKEFSSEMLCCMAPILVRMTQKEADTFNEINIHHCDRSIVGEHIFKAKEFMVKLDFVEKMVQFYHACKRLIIDKNKFNDLFGFIEINGTNQVPFVWNDNRKLVPLFYFDGQSEYLDALSKDLTDIWKICYLKFCCKVQKLRKDLYEQHPFKVVDIEHVKELFSANCTFEVQIPENINQNLISPEIRIAWLHGMEANAQIKINNSSVTDSNHTVAAINNNKTDSVPKNLQRGSPYSDNKLSDPQITVTIRNSQQTNVNQPLPSKITHSELNNSTTKPNNISELNGRLHSPKEIHRLDKINSRLTAQHTVSIVSPNYSSDPQTQLYTSGTNLSRSVMADPISAPNNSSHEVNQDAFIKKSVVSNPHITNVPYQSPRSASSPLRQPSPFMSEATYRNQGLGEVTEITFSSVKQSSGPNNQMGQLTNLNVVYSNSESFENNWMNHRSHNQNILYAQSQTGLHYQNSSYYPSNPYAMNFYQQPSVRMPQSVGKQKTASKRKSHYSAYQNMHQQVQQNIHQLGYPVNYYHDQNKQRTDVSPSNPHVSSLYHPQHTITDPSFSHNIYNVNMNSHNNSLYSAYSSGNFASAQEINYNNDRANLEKRLIMLEYPAVIGPNPEQYTIKSCPLRNRCVLAISKWPNINAFVINLSELAEKILGLNPFNYPAQLVSKFKFHYSLNSVQKSQWDQKLKSHRLEIVGPLKEVFVEYNEALLLF